MDDVSEDVSARILLKHVLHTEPPSSPVTRSASQALVQSTESGVRRSVRLRKSDVMALTPQGALKQSMRKKLHENAYRSSLPMSPRQSKMKSMSEAFSRIKAPATNSFVDDDDCTPRHLLKGILQTVPETSLLIQDRQQQNEPELPSANSSLHSNEPSTGLSDLDLPDLTTTVNLVNTVKGLKRKRPQRSFNVKDFKRQLEHGEDGGGEFSSSTEDLSSLCSSPRSVTLSLKTPFVDAQTEKKAFLRKAPNRKKLTIEEFEEALQNVQAVGRDPELRDVEDQEGETIRSQGFTLGLSDIGPDLTFDIITNRTALYAMPAETTSTFAIATQDKDTITGTQIQREMRGMKDKENKDINEVGERNEEEMELDNKDGVDLVTDAGYTEDSLTQEESKSQTEDEHVAESLTDSIGQHQTGEKLALTDTEDVAESQREDLVESEEDVAESQSEEDVAESQREDEDLAESQSEEDVAESQREDEDLAESQSGKDVAESQSKDNVAESQRKNEDLAESQSEDDVAESQREDEDLAECQSEKDVAESQSEEDVSESQREDEDVAESRTEEEDVAESRAEEEDVADSQTGSAGRRSEGDTAGEWHSGPEVGASESTRPHTGRIGTTPPSPKEENTSPYNCTTSPHPITCQSPADREDDWEDVEEEDDNRSEELSMTTPAFVREKRNALPAYQLSTPNVLKDIQPSVLVSAAVMKKPKVVRRKQAGSAKDLGLPKSYVMGIFKHFAKTKVSTDVYPVLTEILERYFDRLVQDLEAYAAHANRKTIEVEDVELLMRRQGFVTDSMPVNVLIEKYLPMESRKLLIPIATSGNYVIPKPRRK